VLYAVKANPHREVLRVLEAEGLDFDCVSRGEIERVLEVAPALERARILYTPNFASREEYAWALAQGVRVTVDALHPLEHWPQLFAGRELFVRVDTGVGRGHHRHVRTAGAHSKFGIPASELDELARLARRAQARIVGLHTHSGSGILEETTWQRHAAQLSELTELFPGADIVDVGGGLGVPERAGQPALDLARLDAALASVRQAHPRLTFWLESGRFLTAAAGVLLARVTQLKRKGDVRYIGLATGMNSLIRPALYGSYHEIVNLTRLGEPATELVNVVGPICESADVLGHDRLLPPTQENDVLLIATAGAYGHCMSSHYNLREPAAELCLT